MKIKLASLYLDFLYILKTARVSMSMQQCIDAIRLVKLTYKTFFSNVAFSQKELFVNCS